ncbi:MupA/Atu3671 family FMN-dependent luciferase-like monooxygenase [Methylocucumis oryzae]|uniref:Luciferase n=1 Tax=Methylocucumis oryzae TaxID=1632867 RepID=A0A0F3IMM0_9GAMM|nr:MupA/Atu3671 family FMN-dependent luciferase-like monooxygenase [Methylocucumis oryzae]KJV07773.1 luciferase [Methylocucumis oryzae]
MTTVAELLGLQRKPQPATISFSLLFFSDVRKELTDAEKYAFMRELTLFGDREGFTAVYLPERHFHEFGSIYANSAVAAAYLIPQTQRIRFRTAGISLPLHHPAEVVEWWAMNDVLSGGRVDLGFGSGWHKADFILAPDHYHDRRQLCSETIPVIQRLWRGETVAFPGPGGELIPITCYPRPVQKDVAVWLLVTQNDEGFIHAGRQGYNVFTMLYGNNLEAMAKKITLYRQARAEAGLDPASGIVTLMLHTLLLPSLETVQQAVEQPFKHYIKSALDAHVEAAVQQSGGITPSEDEKSKMLDYAYQRYFKTGALFGTVSDGRRVVDEAIKAGVNDIACLLDFGVEQSVVYDSLRYLAELVNDYR